MKKSQLREDGCLNRFIASQVSSLAMAFAARDGLWRSGCDIYDILRWNGSRAPI